MNDKKLMSRITPSWWSRLSLFFLFYWTILYWINTFKTVGYFLLFLNIFVSWLLYYRIDLKFVMLAFQYYFLFEREKRGFSNIVCFQLSVKSYIWVLLFNVHWGPRFCLPLVSLFIFSLSLSLIEKNKTIIDLNWYVFSISKQIWSAQCCHLFLLWRHMSSHDASYEPWVLFEESPCHYPCSIGVKVL